MGHRHPYVLVLSVSSLQLAASIIKNTPAVRLDRAFIQLWIFIGLQFLFCQITETLANSCAKIPRVKHVTTYVVHRFRQYWWTIKAKKTCPYNSNFWSELPCFSTLKFRKRRICNVISMFFISSKYWKTVITFQHSFETKRGCSGICWNAKSTERNESFRQGTLYCTFTTQAYFQLAHITKLISLLTDSNIPVLGRTFNFHLAHSGLFGVDARYKSHFTYSRS